MSDREIRTFLFNIEERKEDSPKITGHAAVFDEIADIGGFFREKVAKGAFKQSIKDDDVRALFNHDPNFVLGRNTAGTLELKEDDKGLAIRIDPPQTQFANDLMILMKRGDISQMSFAFQVMAEEWEENEDELPLRTLKKLRLFDVSPVTYPAYEGTDVGVRSRDAWKKKSAYRMNLTRRLLTLKGENIMSKVNELRQARSEIIVKMEALLEKASTEKRDFTTDEETEYEGMEKSMDGMDKQIVEAEKQETRQRKIAEEKKRLGEFKPVITSLEPDGFRNFGEFLHAVACNPNDMRLQEIRVQQAKDGTSGGYNIPDQFRAELLEVPAAPAIIRPRATVIPAGSPPDSAITMPALDQRASQGTSFMHGGVQVFNSGEGDAITESTARFRQVRLEPKSLTAYVTASNKLVANWDAASATIPRLMRGALVAKEDTDFLSGDGVNKALGILNTPAAININRATANQIGWADVRNMVSRVRTITGSPVWIASQTTIPQLIQIADASSRVIWSQSASAGLPPTLYGYPVMFHDRSPALGTKGDLVLTDLSAYLIKDGSGPIVAVSEHFRFQNDEVAFRLVANVDGQPWLNEPITLEGSTANTVSPFIVLDTP